MRARRLWLMRGVGSKVAVLVAGIREIGDGLRERGGLMLWDWGFGMREIRERFVVWWMGFCWKKIVEL